MIQINIPPGGDNMAIVFQKPKALKDTAFHYCPGCTHGIAHRLVAEVLDELNIEAVSYTHLIRTKPFTEIQQRNVRSKP